VSDPPGYEAKRREALDKLYEIRDELELIALTESDYSKYDRNGLKALQEAGYGVDIPEPGSYDPESDAAGEPDSADIPAVRYWPSCGEGMKDDDRFCRYCGTALQDDIDEG